MNKLMTIALIGVILTAGLAFQAEASEQTINNVVATWHPGDNGMLREIDISFVSTVSQQAVTFTIDGQPAGSSYVFGKESFSYSTGSLYYNTRVTHQVCVNGACTLL